MRPDGQKYKIRSLIKRGNKLEIIPFRSLPSLTTIMLKNNNAGLHTSLFSRGQAIAHVIKFVIRVTVIL